MKIAVYSIAKNEEDFVQRWAESAMDADVRLLLDTGSTDHTVDVAKECKYPIEVHGINISPWRFDTARNAALELVPEDVDYCIALDVDEVLQPGWRALFEAEVAEGVTRPRYKYVWSWNDDGTEGLVYGGDKIHARHGYYWKHPVHEVITPTGIQTECWTTLEIHHHPDPTKSRAHYGPLLEQAAAESPEDDRLAHYNGRERYFHGDYPAAAEELKRHLALPSALWAPERAASMRMLAECEPANRLAWLLRAAAECPDMREPWVALAKYYYEAGDWPFSYACALRALAITEKPLVYLNDAEAWGPAPHDYAAIAAFRLGLLPEARLHGAQALTLAPTDERLWENLRWYESAVPESTSALAYDGAQPTLEVPT